MARTPCFDINGLKKGTWTPEEDWRLIAYVTRYGHWNWRQLPKFAGLARSGKSCRLRWMNYSRPNIKRGNYALEEDETIIKLVQDHGYRWSAIASQLPGRTDNEIKNHWHTNLKKRMQQNSGTKEKAQAPNSSNHSVAEPMANNINGPFPSPSATSQSTNTLLPSSEYFTTTDRITETASNKNLVLEDEFAFLEAFKEPMSDFFLLNDSPVDPMPNNTIEAFQILPGTSQSTDSCPTCIPSSSSELSIITGHTTVASNKNLVPEDEFDFLDALEEPMSEYILLEDSPIIDPMPNIMIDPFQIRVTSQSSNSCPTSTPSFSSELSITTDNNVIAVSKQNLIPEDEFSLSNSYKERMIGSLGLDRSQVEPMPHKIICPPFQNPIPTTSQSTYYSTLTQYSSELFISAQDENVVTEDKFATQETFEKPASWSFCLEPFVGDIAHVASEILLTEPECSVCDVEPWSIYNQHCD